MDVATSPVSESGGLDAGTRRRRNVTVHASGGETANDGNMSTAELAVLDQLRNIIDPDFGMDIVACGFIKNLEARLVCTHTSVFPFSEARVGTLVPSRVTGGAPVLASATADGNGCCGAAGGRGHWQGAL